MTCPFCEYEESQIILRNENCYFINTRSDVLEGSGIILPFEHRESVFDLNEKEIADSFALLKDVKKLLDEKFNPDGYNVGWNCGSVGGQEVFHAHMHVIPRYQDEPHAGKGIRYWIKQKENRRE